jgi:hypothetical protein
MILDTVLLGFGVHSWGFLPIATKECTSAIGNPCSCGAQTAYLYIYMQLLQAATDFDSFNQ